MTVAELIAELQKATSGYTPDSVPVFCYRHDDPGDTELCSLEIRSVEEGGDCVAIVLASPPPAPAQSRR